MGFNLADADQAEGLKHVFYEIEQFNMAVNRLKALGDDFSPEKRNPATEVWLLHMRILIDFFERGQRWRDWDDILSVDYDFPAAPLPISQAVKDRLDKELAHLTYTRTAVTGKEWDVAMLSPSILERSVRFIDSFQHGKWKPQGIAGVRWTGLRAALTSTIDALDAIARNGIGKISGRTD